MKPLRIGLIGCGGIMSKHVREIIAAPRAAKIVGFCDVTAAAIDQLIAKTMSDVKAAVLPPRFDDPARMMREVAMDAVVIATPHTLHADQCEQALRAGLHVLVEKPMVTALPDALKLQELCEQTGLVLCVAYNTPCSAPFAYLRSVRREKTFGELKLVTLWCSQPWHQLTRGTWRQKPELSGGGMLYDTGAHILNSLTWIVDDDVQSVHALIDALDAPVDINGTINVRFAGGTIATATICGQSVSGSGAAFLFESGLVEIDPWNATFLRVFSHEPGHPNKRVEIEPDLPTVTGATPMANFLQVLRGEAEPATTVRHGVIQSQLMDAIYDSARTGQPAEPRT